MAHFFYKRDEIKALVRGWVEEAEELARRLAGCERRVVQLQHEVKRKEREYERLQEK